MTSSSEWQERVGLTDEELFEDYSQRIREAAPFVYHGAIDERAHQFVDQTYVDRLRELANELSPTS